MIRISLLRHSLSLDFETEFDNLILFLPLDLYGRLCHV